MKLPTVEELGELKDKRVLVRCNFDVSVTGGEVVPEAGWRIDATWPFLEELAYRQAKVIVIAHRGRPQGKDEALSLRPVYEYLAEALDAPIHFGAEDPNSGEITLRENLRFNPGETANDEAFAKELSKGADMYINNDFGTAHRAHASVVGVPTHLPSVAGPLLVREVEELSAVRDYTGEGLVLVMGGAKAATKMVLIEQFLDNAEAILVGGVLANTLLRQQGHEVGRSVVDDETDVSGIDLESERLVLPKDVVTSTSLEQAENQQVKLVEEVDAEDVIVDVGPQTRELFTARLLKAQLAVWNGPLGLVEVPAFREGSRVLAESFTSISAKTVAGGGDVVQFLAQENFLDGVSHVSTGGGSMLAFLAGEELPALKALMSHE